MEKVAESGFITTKGRFLGRKEALKMARAARQINTKERTEDERTKQSFGAGGDPYLRAHEVKFAPVAAETLQSKAEKPRYGLGQISSQGQIDFRPFHDRVEYSQYVHSGLGMTSNRRFRVENGKLKWTGEASVKPEDDEAVRRFLEKKGLTGAETLQSMAEPLASGEEGATVPGGQAATATTQNLTGRGGRTTRGVLGDAVRSLLERVAKGQIGTGIRWQTGDARKNAVLSRSSNGTLTLELHEDALKALSRLTPEQRTAHINKLRASIALQSAYDAEPAGRAAIARRIFDRSAKASILS
jgi:hypothetical protein